MLYYFTAKWCGPCKVFGPIVDSVTSALDIEVTKVDVEEDSELAASYNIRNVPTLIRADGERKIGAMTETSLRDWLKNEAVSPL